MANIIDTILFGDDSSSSLMTMLDVLETPNDFSRSTVDYHDNVLFVSESPLVARVPAPPESNLLSEAWKVIDFDKSEANDYDCAICLEKLFDAEDKLEAVLEKEMPCGHRYHGKCMEQWLSTTHRSCPLCWYEMQQPQENEREETRDREEERMQAEDDFRFLITDHGNEYLRCEDIEQILNS